MCGGGWREKRQVGQEVVAKHLGSCYLAGVGRQEGRQLAPELLEAARSVNKGVASGWIPLPVGGGETGERFPQTMGLGRVGE